MGVSSSCFENYHPRNSNTPFENIFCNLHDTATGKNHTFLITPHAHEFAVQQWGSETFKAGSKSCPAGIELEDGGGHGSAGSHPESRIAYSDVMVHVAMQYDIGPFQRFTPLTMAILLDTGFYDIDYRKVQPLIWGNKETNGGKHIENFVMGIPEYVFPQQYIRVLNKDAYADHCGFDFKFIGGSILLNVSSAQNFNCKGSTYNDLPQSKAYCAAEKFYNPQGNMFVGGVWIYDFQIFHFPTIEICQKGYACIGGLESCGKYTIASDEQSFTIPILTRRNPHTYTLYTCNSSNAGKNYTFRVYVGDQYYVNTVRCPPVRQFIDTVRMYENQPYLTKYPFSLSTDPAASVESNEKDNFFGTGLGITVIVFIVIIVISIISVSVFCFVKKYRTHDVEENSIDGMIQQNLTV
jgi:hypothetical protein